MFPYQTPLVTNKEGDACSWPIRPCTDAVTLGAEVASSAGTGVVGLDADAVSSYCVTKDSKLQTSGERDGGFLKQPRARLESQYVPLSVNYI